MTLTGTPGPLPLISDTDSETILSVRELTAYYGKLKAIQNISFDLTRGRTLAVVGESGSGKTTLALAIVGAHSGKVTGEVFFKGHPIQDKAKLRGSKITMVFQDPSSALNPVYTIGWQLLEAINLHFDLDEEEAYRLAIASLEEVQLPNPEVVFEKYPHELSGGQKQRAMIAMAIAVRPDILIADEPTTALDVTIQMEIIELIRKLQRERGMSLLLITHDMGVMAELADDVIVLYAGTAVETGLRTDVLQTPLHPYTQALIQASFLKTDSQGRLLAIKGNVPPLSEMPFGCPFHPRCPSAWDRCRHGTVPDYYTQNRQVKCHLYDPAEGTCHQLVQSSERDSAAPK